LCGLPLAVDRVAMWGEHTTKVLGWLGRRADRRGREAGKGSSPGQVSEGVASDEGRRRCGRLRQRGGRREDAWGLKGGRGHADKAVWTAGEAGALLGGEPVDHSEERGGAKRDLGQHRVRVDALVG
jgi:hypothetical protein